MQHYSLMHLFDKMYAGKIKGLFAVGTDPAVSSPNTNKVRKALEKLETYPHHLTWINALESMRNSPNTEGLHVRLANGSSGWLVYRNTKFTLRSTLSHLIMHTEQGNAEEVGIQLLSHLHTHYSHHDTYAENIRENDPHLSAFQAIGYFTNFSRVEMRRPQP